MILVDSGGFRWIPVDSGASSGPSGVDRIKIPRRTVTEDAVGDPGVILRDSNGAGREREGRDPVNRMT